MHNRSYYEDNYRRFLPRNLSAPILDLGCGEGDLLRYLSSLGYRHAVGVDRDEKSVTALDGLPGVTVKVAEANAGSLEHRCGGWAMIVAKQMIYYFDRREAPALIAGLARELEPEGFLIVEVFNGALLSSRFTELKDPAILTAYTENGLKRLLEDNGFVVEHLFGAVLRGSGLKGTFYFAARSLWFRLYRLMLILERGRDAELPRISSKSIIAVAKRRKA